MIISCKSRHPIAGTTRLIGAGSEKSAAIQADKYDGVLQNHLSHFVPLVQG